MAAEAFRGEHGSVTASPPPDLDAVPALPVGAVARLLGMAPASLRTWDRRYGLGPSGHTVGAHRRYTAQDVARLTLMRRLVLEGTGAAEAARVAAHTPADELLPAVGRAIGGRLSLVPPATGASDDGVAGEDELAPAAARLAAEITAAVRQSTPLSALDGRAGVGPGTGQVPAHALRLAWAVLLLDAPAITALVLDATSRQGVVATWESLVAPVLRSFGRRWEEFGTGVEVEHVFAESVLAVLRHRLVVLGGAPATARPVLLACGPEEQHALPLHAIAAALAERRVGATVLGARVPAQALSAAFRRSRASATFVWSQTPGTAVLDLAGLRAVRADFHVVVGGPGWDPRTLAPEVLFVDDFSQAVDTLVALAG